MTAFSEKVHATQLHSLHDVAADLAASGKRVIFTMGKGGVGKTTVAAAIALNLAKMWKSVHLATTDPATHLKFVLDESSGISMSRIDEAEELRKYQNEVLSKAKAAGLSGMIWPISRKTFALPAHRRSRFSVLLQKSLKKRTTRSL